MDNKINNDEVNHKLLHQSVAMMSQNINFNTNIMTKCINKTLLSWKNINTKAKSTLHNVIGKGNMFSFKLRGKSRKLTIWNYED